MPDWPNIFAALRADGLTISDDDSPGPVGGGDISAAWRVGPAFVKTGGIDSLEMLQAEAEGLQELNAAGAIRVPKVLGVGSTENDAYFATEWIDFDRPTSDIERLLGEQLAAMHRCTKDRFGWHRDNTIGLTPQHNDLSDDWVDFFRTRRLGFQLELADRNGFGGDLQSAGRKLGDNLEAFFKDYVPAASLLHGDLWGGNWAAAKGQPVIFDPAVYYGDRESDIAMTQLFGGFGAEFYSAYRRTWPLETGFEDRLRLYQLYHVLNHLNLFGGSYLGRAMQLICDLRAGTNL